MTVAFILDNVLVWRPGKEDNRKIGFASQSIGNFHQ